MKLAKGYTLAIMVGNTNTVVGVFGGDRFDCKWRMETRPGRTADEYADWLLNNLHRYHIKHQHVQAVVVGSAIPAINTVLKSMARRYFNVEALVVGKGVKTGVNISYNGLAADRLANLVAAQALFKPPYMVVDLGMHTSLDVVDKDGNYQGGIVTVGEWLMQHSLMDRIALTPALEMSRPLEMMGKDLQQSMQSGSYWGMVAMLDGLIKRLWDDLGYKGAVIATGGFAQDLAGDVAFDAVDTNLTLYGLKAIYDRQSPKPVKKTA